MPTNILGDDLPHNPGCTLKKAVKHKEERNSYFSGMGAVAAMGGGSGGYETNYTQSMSSVSPHSRGFNELDDNTIRDYEVRLGIEQNQRNDGGLRIDADFYRQFIRLTNDTNHQLRQERLLFDGVSTIAPSVAPSVATSTFTAGNLPEGSHEAIPERGEITQEYTQRNVFNDLKVLAGNGPKISIHQGNSNSGANSKDKGRYEIYLTDTESHAGLLAKLGAAMTWCREKTQTQDRSTVRSFVAVHRVIANVAVGKGRQEELGHLGWK